MAKGVYVWEQGSVGKEAVWSTLQIIMYYTERAVQVSDVYIYIYVCMEFVLFIEPMSA